MPAAAITGEHGAMSGLVTQGASPAATRFTAQFRDSWQARSLTCMRWSGPVWPESAAPPSAEAWRASVRAVEADISEFERMASDPKSNLYAKIPWGDGQTILREALLIADHNAYHLGQLVDLRRLLGTWPG